METNLSTTSEGYNEVFTTINKGNANGEGSDDADN